MTAHTPGPWEVFPNYTSGQIDIGPIEHHSNLVRCVATFGMEEMPDASRIVACVNACEGMDDPAAELELLRDMAATLLDSNAGSLRAERDALRLEVERNGEAIKLVADQADAWRLERDALRGALQGMVAAFCPRVDITVAREGGKALHPSVKRALQMLGALLPDDQDSAALAQGSEK